MANDSIASRKLAMLKTAHAVIYLVIVLAIFYILYAAVTKTYGYLLYIATVPLIIDAALRIANAMECPLTTLAKQYGDPKGYVGSTLFSERFSKYLFRFFVLTAVVDLAILILDVLKVR